MIDLIRFVRLHWASRPSSSQKPKSHLIICLTTTPERIKYLKPTLASLHDQSVLPSAIHLYLPRLYKGKEAYRLPGFLKDWPLLKVINEEGDLGPATKWFYAIHDLSIKSHPLIVLDDDQIYPHHLVEHYQQLVEQFPYQAQTLYGWNVPVAMDHKKRKPVQSGKLKLFGEEEIVCKTTQVDCLQGTSSYLIPVNRPEITIDQLISLGELKFADDILLSGLLAEQNISLWVSPLRAGYIRMHTMKKGNYQTLLASKNQDSSLNNSLYHHFKRDWPSLNQVT